MKAKCIPIECNSTTGVATIQFLSEFRSFASIHWQKNKGKVQIIDITKWYKKRTTGEESQNHHINGHIQQICMITGNSFSAVKEYMKSRAIDRGYPFETLPNGDIAPKSESEINTLEAGYLIDTIHQEAAAWSIKLIDGDWGNG